LATIQNNIIDAGAIGIACTNSNPSIDNNSVINHVEFGIINNTNSIIIDAQNNWWGDATGPLDDSDDTGTGGWYNPGGAGSRVSDYINYQNWLVQPPVFSGIVANLKVYLQGPYNGSNAMTTTLNTILPLSSEDAYPVAVYDYTPSTVASIPNTDIVDWVLVELRANSTTKVDERAAFLKSDGTIVDIDGSSPVTFTGYSNGDYYIVVRHRNHLAIMTATAIPLSSSSALYNFTDDMNKAFSSGGDPMVLIGGNYVMRSGDADRNGSVLAPDYTLWRNQNGIGVGYLDEDFDLNGNVLAPDYNLDWRPNNGTQTQVP
jgi:hypothetical protein